MKFVYNDGGRKDAGYTGSAGDCGVRAICIASSLPYQEVYDAINEMCKSERITKRRRTKSSARNGLHKDIYRKYMSSLGWEWTPTMHIGSGCTVHLHDGELPDGRLVVSVSKHWTCVIDGMIYDTYDAQRTIHYTEDGGSKHFTRRCVYGYWQAPDTRKL